jgi:hypothetical protein
MTARAPRASLIMPTFNHLRYLPLAVDTALRQTLDEFELIIVNDGSTDGTRDWLDALRDTRIRVIHQDNRGPAEAINAGVRASKAEYLSWISADNFCAPYFVEAFVAALDADPSNILAYSPFYTINAENQIEGIKFDNLLLLRELVTNRPRGVAGFMYRKSLHEHLGMYEGWALDTLMWSRVMEQFSAVFVLEPTYYYRFHEERATVTQNSRVTDAVSKITPAFLDRFKFDQAGYFERLYPGLHKAPQQLTHARSDFASRLAQTGFKIEALELLGSTLATAAQDELVRPLVNAVGVCMMCGIDPTAFVLQALAGNAKLSPESIEAATDVADALALIISSSGQVELLGIEANSLLRALEKPKVFSYTAWRHDKSTVPVRGV